MNKRTLKIILAIIRQVAWPHDIFDRTRTGAPLYRVSNLPPGSSAVAGPALKIGEELARPITQPVPLPWASLAAKLISLAVTVCAALFMGDQVDVAFVEALIRQIFGEA